MPSIHANRERNISLIMGLVITALTLTAGITGFLIMQQQSKANLSMGLETTLQSKISLFEFEISQGILNSESAITHSFLHRTLLPETNKEESLAKLEQTASSLLATGFTSVIIRNSENEELLNAGVITQNPEMIVQLETASNINAFLLCAN